MKMRKISKILIALLAASVLFVGCGEQETTRKSRVSESSETRNEREDSKWFSDMKQTAADSLFPGTILDELVIGETRVTDVEGLLEDRILEYENKSSKDNYLSGKTTITDKFYEWEALYKYAFVHLESKDDLVLKEWTVEILLDDDEEYKEAVKRIQNTIEENRLTEYEPVDDSYHSDTVKGDVVYYPVKKLEVDGTDSISCVMFGKFPNCNSEEAKHVVVLKIGVASEENYLRAGETKGPKVVEIEPDKLVIHEEEKENVVMKGYMNVALFGVDAETDSQLFKNSRSDSIMIASINVDTGDIKLVSVCSDTFLNLGMDEYNKCNEAYSKGGAEQAVKMLNMNFDMNITDFVTVGYEGLSKVIDGLGGVYIDVDSEELKHINNYQIGIADVLKCDYKEVTQSGYQLLDGLQATAYCCIRYTKEDDFKRNFRQREVLKAIEEQAKSTDAATLVKVFNDVIGDVYTSIDSETMLQLIENIVNYRIVDENVFPQENMCEEVTLGAEGDFIVPVDLEANVKWLHQFLFGQDDYEVSSDVKEYSEKIKEKTSR